MICLLRLGRYSNYGPSSATYMSTNLRCCFSGSGYGCTVFVEYVLGEFTGEFFVGVIDQFLEALVIHN